MSRLDCLGKEASGRLFRRVGSEPTGGGVHSALVGRKLVYFGHRLHGMIMERLRPRPLHGANFRRVLIATDPLTPRRRGGEIFKPLSGSGNILVHSASLKVAKTKRANYDGDGTSAGVDVRFRVHCQLRQMLERRTPGSPISLPPPDIMLFPRGTGRP